MAFGKPPDRKSKYLAPVLADQLWRAHVRSEDTAKDSWHNQWGWILKEFDDLHRQLQEASKASATLKELKPEAEPDPRSLKPIPNTTNHEYGWLPSRPEFRLERYGPDVERWPLPED